MVLTLNSITALEAGERRLAFEKKMWKVPIAAGIFAAGVSRMKISRVFPAREGGGAALLLAERATDRAQRTGDESFSFQS